MIILLTPLLAVTVFLNWQSEQATTYSIQTSSNLQEWLSLPFLVEGTGQAEVMPVETEESILFARLRYSDDGDTNGNGLPDMWEWEQFGYLDVDPEADADSDGRSNFTEWLDATDPLDFYDGQTPVIRLACGSSWLVPAGQASGQLLYASVFHPSGEPWGNAPVSISMHSGEQRILAGGEPSTSAVAAMVRWTNENGQLHPDFQPVQAIAPELPGQLDRIILEAGRARTEVLVRSIGTDLGPPPRQLKRTAAAPGASIYSWSGLHNGASHFLLQEQQPDGTWADIALIPTADLPPPDPATGTYSLTIDSNAG